MLLEIQMLNEQFLLDLNGIVKSEALHDRPNDVCTLGPLVSEVHEVSQMSVCKKSG